jgi:hypothetical protein
VSKKADNLHDAAEAPLIRPEPAPPRLHKIPGRVDRADMAVILRAITLYLAKHADLDDDTIEKSGAALAAICRAYLLFEREQRSPRP